MVSRLLHAERIEITPIARDKYFRVLSLVVIDGQDLADELVTAHLATAYDGETKVGWCS